MNLFSVFDPSSFYGIQLNWVIMLLIVLFMLMKYYLVSSSSQLFKNSLILSVNGLFVEIAGSSNLAITFIATSTFFYLVVTNLLGLFPFIFTSTAHPLITMSLGVIFWSSFFLMGWTKSFKESAAHLVPEGSPLGLSPLMVLIESISHLMRPFTLSIRLAANMMAGHLIISLLSSISLLSLYSFSISVFLQSVLLILELGVAVIQGFVFSILLLLYCLEYY
uniref:ATP synthase subunit a n=1 Tax=Tetragnatha maxillosa TaxID=216284 RepID=A0A0A0YQ37_9ARAC|nr:ATP synthase F0 subunit 6 [Tetragnatha maxillosa]AIX11781.1 ATP synthase F0 subunit 6 [Tetragnatha maxillosa]